MGASTPMSLGSPLLVKKYQNKLEVIMDYGSAFESLECVHLR